MRGPDQIADPKYWKQRMDHAAPDNFHHSIFLVDKSTWQRIEDKHREILKTVLTPWSSVLDAGCGYGRLLTLMPQTWEGKYLGVDLSPDFVDLAKRNHRLHNFVVGDLRHLPVADVKFDFGVLISIRPMIKRHLGEEEWAKAEAELRRVCRQLLYLEYDVNDNGSLE